MRGLAPDLCEPILASRHRLIFMQTNMFTRTDFLGSRRIVASGTGTHICHT